MPWSNVYQIDTNHGYIYLKKMAVPFNIEPAVISYLAPQYPNLIPKIIATNKTLDCFLMLDSGISLRQILKRHYDVYFPTQVLIDYANLQRQVSHQLDLLSPLNLLDWRVGRIPALYRSLIEQYPLLKEDGLTESEINKLKALHPEVIALCEELAVFHIPETLEHGDFHDNNILINENQVIIHDWGDAILTHPFFSLVSFLKSAERNHCLKPESPHYLAMKEAYLSQWLDDETPDRLLEVFNRIWLLSPIKFVLSFYRVTLCPGMNTLQQYKGTIADNLREFMNQF